MRVKDTKWCITKSTLLAQQNLPPHTCDVLASLPNKGFVNSDGNVAMLGVFYNAC